jgi:hypothetical protein
VSDKTSTPAKPATGLPMPPAGNVDELKQAMKAVENAQNWLTEKCPEQYRAWALASVNANLAPPAQT